MLNILHRSEIQSQSRKTLINYAFMVGSVRQIKPTHVGFRAHVKIASRIVSYGPMFLLHMSKSTTTTRPLRLQFAPRVSAALNNARVCGYLNFAPPPQSPASDTRSQHHSCIHASTRLPPPSLAKPGRKLSTRKKYFTTTIHFRAPFTPNSLSKDPSPFCENRKMG